MKLFNLYKIQKATTTSREFFINDDGIKCVHYGDIYKNYSFRFIKSSKIINTFSKEVKNSMILKEDSIIIPDVTETVSDYGHPTYIKYDGVPYINGTHALAITSAGGNLKYLFYYLQNPSNIKRLQSLLLGSTVFGISIKDFENFELINYKEADACQQHIVDIIGSIDDKIENNNKIIDNNYKMLNLEMKKYIKNEFISIGESKHISLIKSGIDKFDRNKIYLDTSSVNGYSITDESYIITYDERPSRANMQPIINSIWFAKLKNSPKYIVVKDYSADLINNKIFSTGFCGLKIDKDFFNLFSTYITSEEFNKNKDQLCIGATMQGVNNSDINNIKIPNFSKNDCENFNIISEPIYKYIYNLTQENKKLLELKDLYLKKFFS